MTFFSLYTTQGPRVKLMNAISNIHQRKQWSLPSQYSGVFASMMQWEKSLIKDDQISYLMAFGLSAGVSGRLVTTCFTAC